MNQWTAIDTAYGDLSLAYFYENPLSAGDDNEELKFQMFGFNFVFDMLALKYLQKPLQLMMEVTQNLQLPHWKMHILRPLLHDYLTAQSSHFKWRLYHSLYNIS